MEFNNVIKNVTRLHNRPQLIPIRSLRQNIRLCLLNYWILIYLILLQFYIEHIWGRRKGFPLSICSLCKYFCRLILWFSLGCLIVKNLGEKKVGGYNSHIQIPKSMWTCDKPRNQKSENNLSAFKGKTLYSSIFFPAKYKYFRQFDFLCQDCSAFVLQKI